MVKCRFIPPKHLLKEREWTGLVNWLKLHFGGLFVLDLDKTISANTLQFADPSNLLKFAWTQLCAVQLMITKYRKKCATVSQIWTPFASQSVFLRLRAVPRLAALLAACIHPPHPRSTPPASPAAHAALPSAPPHPAPAAAPPPPAPPPPRSRPAPRRRPGGRPHWSHPEQGRPPQHGLGAYQVTGQPPEASDGKGFIKEMQTKSDVASISNSSPRLPKLRILGLQLRGQGVRHLRPVFGRSAQQFGGQAAHVGADAVGVGVGKPIQELRHLVRSLAIWQSRSSPPPVFEKVMYFKKDTLATGF